MRKPEKFNEFIDAVMKEARRDSLADVCSYYDINEKEMEVCLDWLEELQKIDKIPKCCPVCATKL